MIFDYKFSSMIFGFQWIQSTLTRARKLYIFNTRRFAHGRHDRRFNSLEKSVYGLHGKSNSKQVQMAYGCQSRLKHSNDWRCRARCVHMGHQEFSRFNCFCVSSNCRFESNTIFKKFFFPFETLNRFLVNLIPVLRNEHSIIEYVVSGVVSGTLAGHLFADRDALGFEKTTKPKRMTYKQLCLLRGVGYGLLLGIVSGVYVTTSKSHSTATEIRKWEKYWKQRRQQVSSHSNHLDCGFSKFRDIFVFFWN